MYAQASHLQALPVISLQTGEVVAVTRSPIIDIATLEIHAYHCEGARQKQPLVLMSRDIRQLATDCVIIDTEEELMGPSDIIRLEHLMEANFSPIDKAVISDTGRKLGHVEDYIVNLDTNQVQKLHVRPGILRAWMGSSVIIDRSQIIDITPKTITVRDALIKAPLLQSEPIPETPS